MSVELRVRLLGLTWVGLLAAAAVAGETLQAMGAPEDAPVSVPTMTVRPATAVAQNGLGAVPLQGPLGSPATGGSSGCCPCRHVSHRVVHRSVRVARQPAPARVALVPLVPLVPYRPVLVYRPLVAYRPLVPVFAYRPFFYRPFFYRPFYGPRFY